MSREPERRAWDRERHWPRDAPIRWGSFARGVAFQVVALVAVGAQMALAVATVAAILGTEVEGAGEWLLAIVWGAGALWQFRAWLVHDWSIAVPPIVSLLLVVAL